MEDGDEGTLLDPHHKRAGMRLAERAILNRWPVAEEDKKFVVERMRKILANKRSNHRDAVRAARVLLAAEAQNQSDTHHSEGGHVTHEIAITVEQKRIELTKLADRFGVGNLLDAVPVNGEGKHHPAVNGVHKTNGKPSTNGHT